jgi:hypothetical protein
LSLISIYAISLSANNDVSPLFVGLETFSLPRINKTPLIAKKYEGRAG